MSASTLTLRNAAVAAIKRHQRGEASLEEAYRLIDLYREAIRRHAPIAGRRVRVPSRAYLYRALS